MVNMNDVLKQFDGKVVEGNEDKSIQALNGRYKAEIKKFGLVEMKDGGSFFSINLCITQTIDGIKGDGRYVSKTYNNGKTQYAEADENMESLLRGLVSMGIEKGNSWDELVENCKGSVGKAINIKLRPNKKGGEVKTDDKGWPKHFVTVVKEFDMTKVKESSKTEGAVNGNVPF